MATYGKKAGVPRRLAFTSIPSGTASLVWAYTGNGQYLPANNLDATSCLVIGAVASGSIYGSGETVNLQFTTAGGQPTNGQTVWLASSQDDSNTGRGKATATQPSLSMPVYPLFTQNIVPVGICVDNSGYSGSKTCVVRLSLPTQPNFTPLTNQTFSNLHRVSCPDTHRDGTLSGSSWQNGESLFLAFTCDQTANVGTNFVLYNLGSGSGWQINCDTSVFVAIPNVGFLVMGPPRPGLNIVCCTRTGGNFRASLNGLAVVTMADSGTSPGASPTMGISYTRGGITGIVKLTRALSDGELVAFSGGNSCALTVGGGTPGNFFAPPATLTTDLACQWYLDLTSYVSGTITTTGGPAGSGFSFTNASTPVSTAFSYVWNRNPAGLYLDGPTPSYDSKHLARDRQLQRVAYTASSVFDLGLLVAGYSLDDTDNGDEGAAAVLINGTPLGNIGAAETGVARYSPLWDPAIIGGTPPMDTIAGLTPPYHVEILVQDKLTRIDTFDSGGTFLDFVYPASVTFDTPATSKRLVVIADGETYGGHSADFGSSAAGTAVLTRVRADYPGRVSAFGVQATQSTASIKSWGNGSMQPYADYVFAYAHEGAPSTVVYFIALGFCDWFNTPPTPVATFATDIAAFIDRLHANDPTASFAVAKPVQTHLNASTNSNGDTLASFGTSVAGLATGRSWLTVLDLTGPNAIAFQGSPITINPTPASGQNALKANIKVAAVIGY